MRTKIMEALKAALGGSRKVKITFKQETVTDLAYLMRMERVGLIQLDDNDKANLTRVLKFGGWWENDSNRTTIVTLTAQFNENWFLARMERALEAIEVAG